MSSDSPHIQVTNVTVENITISPGLAVDAAFSAVNDMVSKVAKRTRIPKQLWTRSSYASYR